MWQTLREKKPWFYAVAGGPSPASSSWPASTHVRGACAHRTPPPRAAGAAVLVAYGAIPTLQPEGATFSRVYAVYGGVFIALSYAWGWAVDGDRPDTGDWAGAAIALAGVALAWFWPRRGG